MQKPLTMRLAGTFRQFLMQRGWRSSGERNPELWSAPRQQGVKTLWYSLPHAVLIARKDGN